VRLSMNKRGMKGRIVALGATLVVAGGLVVAAGGTTGAYFSDSNLTSQSSTIARVAINTPQSSSVAFSNLLAGDSQSRIFTVTNTGTVPANIFIKRYPVTGLPSGDSSPSKLSVGFTSAASGLYSDTADASPASVLIASSVAPGASFTYTLTLTLDSSAGGTWDSPTNWNAANGDTFSVTVPVKLVAAQVSAGWQTIT